MFDATIIITAWNAVDTIERSICSALKQAGISVEVIVVDDASTDKTPDKLAENPEIVFERLLVNVGPAQARNRALELAQGDWIVVLDADDTMAPHRVAHMIDLAKQTGADIVLGNFRKVNEDGMPLADPFFLPNTAIDTPCALTLADYVGRNQVKRGGQSIGYLKPILSRKFVAQTGLRYDSTLRNGEDCHLIFAALAAGAKVVISQAPDYFYTVRPGSISHRANPSHIKALIAADHAFLVRHAETLDTKTRRLFESREVGLTEMMVSERVLTELKSGNLVSVCKTLYGSPWVVVRVLRQIAEGIGRRIRIR